MDYYIFNKDKRVIIYRKVNISRDKNEEYIIEYHERTDYQRGKTCDTSYTKRVNESKTITKEYYTLKLTQPYKLSKLYRSSQDSLIIYEYGVSGTVSCISYYILDKNKNVLSFQQFYGSKKNIEAKNVFSEKGELLSHTRSSFYSNTITVKSLFTYNKYGFPDKQVITDNLGNNSELNYKYIIDKNNDWEEITQERTYTKSQETTFRKTRKIKIY